MGCSLAEWELLVLLRYLGERGYLSGLRIILLWGGILLKGIIRIGLVICGGLYSLVSIEMDIES